ETVNTSESGPTKRGVRICLSAITGTSSSLFAAAARTSPQMPEPPMPHTTMLRRPSTDGNASAGTAPAARCAASSCSGRPHTASRKPSESSSPPAAMAVLRGLERRPHAVGLRLGEQPLVLRVVGVMGLLDQHDRDVVAHV